MPYRYRNADLTPTRQRLFNFAANMQFTALLATVAALTASVVAAPTNQVICQQKSQSTGSGAYAAIQSFCSRTDVTANSQYAIKGTHGGVMGKGMTSHVFIAPSGSCPKNSNW